MKIRTWYNTTQDKYFTDYTQPVLDYDYGYVNKQGHILISNTYFYNNKVFHGREAREKYFNKNIHGVKNRVKRKLINFIKKL